MKYININESTNIVATLSEKTQLGNPYYIWKLVDADTRFEYIFSADDISPAPYNYNMFSFSVIPGATYGATAGIIPAPQGVYTYTCYTTETQYSLDIGDSGIVETGIFKIQGTVSSVITLTNNRTIPTLKNL